MKKTSGLASKNLKLLRINIIKFLQTTWKILIIVIKCLKVFDIIKKIIKNLKKFFNEVRNATNTIIQYNKLKKQEFNHKRMKRSFKRLIKIYREIYS